jgi:hypothetical protein
MHEIASQAKNDIYEYVKDTRQMSKIAWPANVMYLERMHLERSHQRYLCPGRLSNTADAAIAYPPMESIKIANAGTI